MYGLSSVSMCLVGLALASQDPAAQDSRSALALVPDKAIFVAEFDGPAAWAERFAKTRLVDVLQSPDVSPHVKGAIEMVEKKLGPALEALGYDYREIRDGVVGYDGRVAFGFGGDLSSTLDPAGKTDLWAMLVLPKASDPKVKRAMQKLVELVEDNAKDYRFRDLEVEGRTLRCGVPADKKSEPSIVLPFLIGDNAVVLAADDVEKLARTVLTNKAHHYQDFEQRAREKSLAFYVAFAPILTTIVKAAESEPSPFAALVKPLLDGIGLSVFRDVWFSVGAAGERLVMDMEVQLGPGSRGVMGMAYPPRKNPPRLLDFVPVHRETWSAAPMDFALGYRELVKLADLFADMTEHSAEELEQMFEAKTKLRLKEDLIDHLGDELLSVQGTRDPQSGAGPDAPMQDFEAVCYGIALRDSAAFGKSFDRLLRSFAMHVSRKTESYGQFKVSRFLPFGAFPVHYCVTDELFLVAVGDSGANELRAVLDEVKDRRAGKPRPAMPREVSDRLELAYDGWHGISVVSLSQLFSTIYDSITSEMGMVMDRDKLKIAEGARDLVTRLLRTHKLDLMVSTSKTHGGRVMSRAIW